MLMFYKLNLCVSQCHTDINNDTTSIFPFSFCLSQKTKNPSFSLFFSSLVSRPRRPLDGYLRNWPGFVASSHCHFAIIHPHVTHCSFTLFDLVVSENKFSLFCLTFTGTLNQLHFTLLFMFTSFRTISYFSFVISLFLWSMLAWSRSVWHGKPLLHDLVESRISGGGVASVKQASL